jgi:hypothetical protein
VLVDCVLVVQTRVCVCAYRFGLAQFSGAFFSELDSFFLNVDDTAGAGAFFPVFGGDDDTIDEEIKFELNPAGGRALATIGVPAPPRVLPGRGAKRSAGCKVAPARGAGGARSEAGRRGRGADRDSLSLSLSLSLSFFKSRELARVTEGDTGAGDAGSSPAPPTQ